MTKIHDIELEIHELGYKCQVSVNGQVLPVDRLVLRVDVNSFTELDVHGYKVSGEPYRFKGFLVEAEHYDELTAAMTMLKEYRRGLRGKSTAGQHESSGPPADDDAADVPEVHSQRVYDPPGVQPQRGVEPSGADREGNSAGH